MLKTQRELGGIERETGACFLKAVSDRSENALLPVIEDHLEAQMQVIIDC